MSDFPREVSLKGLKGYVSKIDDERSVSFFPVQHGAVWVFKWGDNKKIVSLSNEAMDAMDAFRCGYEKLGAEGFAKLYDNRSPEDGRQG